MAIVGFYFVRQTSFRALLFLLCWVCSVHIFAHEIATSSSEHPSKRDVLWGFSQCLKGKLPAVQVNPRSPLHVCGVTVFGSGNKNAPDSVIIEDFKMAKCWANSAADESNPRSFAYMHALAMPLSKVTGVEQEESRPNGLWNWAWLVATDYIADASEIALVANPKANNQYRSQDQLHIHLVRLLPGAKDEILHPRSARRVPVSYIDSLEGSPDPVWAAAELNAGNLGKQIGISSGLKSGAFGVAVVFDESKGKYAVATLDESPERDFTMPCPGGAWQP